MHGHLSGRKIGYAIFIHAILVISLVVAMFPIYWMINTSLKLDPEIYRKIPTFFPEAPTLAAYRKLFSKTAFLKGLNNSIMYALCVSFLTIFFCMLASYSIVNGSLKMHKKGGEKMYRSGVRDLSFQTGYC